MSDTLIKVEGVSKKFCRSLKKSLWYGMQDLGREITGRKHGGEGELRPDEFWAVNDVSFELKRGECLGLIGRNGAGKTTLLRMLNGLIKPDRGRIEMRGRVGALIALGAGFNPILTGRENIYVNASVLGLTKQEIDAKLDEIIDFAEIGEFIDMPVQSYSSGMGVRLGFAVASAIEPDILILDEILAVGDASFRAKCFSRIGQLQNRVAAVFVSHAMDQVARLCSNALYLERGSSSGASSVEEAAELYERQFSNHNSDRDSSFEKLNYPIKSIKSVDRLSIKLGDDLAFDFEITSNETIEKTYFRLVFFNLEGMHCAELNSRSGNIEWKLKVGINKCRLYIRKLSLRPGTFKVGLMFFREENIEPLFWLYKKIVVDISGPRLGLSPYLITDAEITSK
jgi:lipopolysaccharide transport system ATP-binding protein